ncbi:hypothetical protein BO70DRAFT_86903 [Aspergillus heteromorphus CBS 117.55]|uniref:Uncharacterized protein n=1 Tax=Aspergillus heteromorphus CBS 117.55 TaxID=1448321 RepID=A0A317WYT7_9EURO|nr:uncharacterized protein BO70DRAFT_86903 [Aspergillus heteromorphus CBS 117.55]PWY91165.1 hypothetical protein BO70DRAFT_86903 [Aspergillus heteromorphus CBS 117.55]
MGTIGIYRQVRSGQVRYLASIIISRPPIHPLTYLPTFLPTCRPTLDISPQHAHTHTHTIHTHPTTTIHNTISHRITSHHMTSHLTIASHSHSLT